MSVLRSRHSQQGLMSHGVFVADQPGRVLQGKDLRFYSFVLRLSDPPSSQVESLRAQVQRLVDRARSEQEWASLHLYYLDSDGHGLLTLTTKEGEKTVDPPLLEGDGHRIATSAVTHALWTRRYEAVGQKGMRYREHEDRRDLFSALEGLLNAHERGWASQLFARDEAARRRIFDHYLPMRSGVFRVVQWIEDLRFVQSLTVVVGADGEVGFRPVVQNLERATLEEVLEWN